MTNKIDAVSNNGAGEDKTEGITLFVISKQGEYFRELG